MKDGMSWKLSEEDRIRLGDKFAGYINQDEAAAKG
jgi:hypothetical protein